MHGIDWAALSTAVVAIIAAISAATVAIINAVHGVHTSVVEKAAETQAANVSETAAQTEALKEVITASGNGTSGGH